MYYIRYPFFVSAFRFVMEGCLSVFLSPVADMETKSMILRLLGNCLKHRSLANDLFKRYNLATWIAMAVEFPNTSKPEKSALCRHFLQLTTHLRDIEHENSSDRNKSTTTLSPESLLKMNAAKVSLVSFCEERKALDCDHPFCDERW
jgi:hypothetical protein